MIDEHDFCRSIKQSLHGLSFGKKEAKNTISKREQKWLDNFRENEKETIDAIVGTKLVILGLNQRVINLDDEIYGAYKAAGDFIKNRDLQSAKEAYASTEI